MTARSLQNNPMCMMPDWSPPEGILVCCAGKECKSMLPDREAKPCKPILMKNVQGIIKDISCFIQYWECLRVAMLVDHFTIDMELG